MIIILPICARLGEDGDAGEWIQLYTCNVLDEMFKREVIVQNMMVQGLTPDLMVWIGSSYLGIC